MDFLTEHRDRLALFAGFSGKLGARADYVQGGGGNTSVKLAGGLMAIKASGFCLSDIKPDKAYAVLNSDALRVFYLDTDPETLDDVEAAGSSAAKAAVREVAGVETLRPSVEAGFHSILDGFVAHTHSVYGNLAACSQEADAILKSALSGAGYGYALIPYVDPGARLTFAIRDALREGERRTGSRPKLLLLQNHGIVAHDDDMDECLRIHEDANLRIAAHFDTSAEEFPEPRVKAAGEGAFMSDTPWLAPRLKGDDYPDELLLQSPLYPDQMVFFQGNLGEKAVINRQTGQVLYNLPEKTSLTLEETLCAVVFIMETIARKGYRLSVMGDAARRFIDGWESEKYRKSLAEKAT